MHKTMVRIIWVLTTALLVTACGDQEGSVDQNTSSQAPAAAQPAKVIQASSSVDTLALHNDALKFYNAGDSAKAFGLFSEASAAGNRDSMFFLGLMYERGQSVDVDYEKAVEWYTKSDALGCGSAAPALKTLKAKMAKK